MKDTTSELVRVTAAGEVHAVGVTAARRLRASAGAFRLLPAPPHVLLLRRTGEDGRRDAEDGRLVRLAGEIPAPGALADVLAMIGHTRWRGELAVLNGDVRRSVFLEYGNVVGATTNVAEERLGEVMYRYGAIDDALQRAISARVREGVRFGQAVVELGLATEQQVYEFLGKQIEEIAHAALASDDGTFFFLDGFDGERLVSRHTFSISGLLMEGVTRLDEIRYFRQTIPSEDWVPVRTDRVEPPADELEAVYFAVDGVRSVADIGRLTGLGEFETTKAVYALAHSKHVEMSRPRVTGGPESVVAIANRALRMVHRRLDEAGAGQSLRDRLASFAVGAGVYDVLFHGAGPQRDGSLLPAMVVSNVGRVTGVDAEEYLKAKLHEYVSFALFLAGSALGPEAETALSQDIEVFLAGLQPRG